MTPTNSLLELAWRCEEASEGSSELDLAISEAILSPDDFDELRSDIIHLGRSAPRYSSSLDAAMTLVSDDRGVTLQGRANAWMATVFSGHYSDPFCKSPALALCAAALRARDYETTTSEPASRIVG